MTNPTPPLDPRVFSPRAGERTAAIATAAIGAALMFAAAGIFIAIKWETMGLTGKAGVVGMVALGALAAGHWLKGSAPGVAAVLTHLGGFLIPIDAGGIATSLGLDRPHVALVGGATGLAVLTALDRRRSPYMALGRVLSMGGLALGAGALMTVPPAVLLVPMAALAAVLVLRTGRFQADALGLSLLASLSPAFAFASSFTTEGSLITWLARQSEQTPLATTLVATLMIGLALVTNRRWPGLTVTSAIAVISLPSVVATVGDHTGYTMVFLASTMVAGRLLVDRLNAAAWQHHLDISTAGTTLVVGWLSLDRLAPNFDWATIASAGLLAVSWLLSDLETGRRVDAGDAWYRHLWTGASGPVSTAGLAASAIIMAVGTDAPLSAAWILMGATALVGLSERQHATLVARIGLPIATLLTFGEPYYALAFGLASAFLLQARASMDLFAGRSPRLAAATQLSGLIGLVVAIVRYSMTAADETIAVNLVGASLITFTLTVLALAADRLPVPDLRNAPRLLLGVAVLPLLNDLSVAGVWAILVAGLLVADVLVHRLWRSEVIAGSLLIAGTWMLGAGQSVEAGEMYAIGPALVLLWFGLKAMREGTSSWLGVAPAVGLLGGVAIVERLELGAGWHSAFAGAVGLIALGIGVERKWAGSAVAGSVVLAAPVLIEVSAVVPRIPVWMLLASGGMVLLGTGLTLERRAGLGDTASLRATWAQFH